MFYSPLRYPGGKNRLSKFISDICLENNIDGHYIEPYAGGAAVALYLLMERKVKQITINDFDRSIYAFWYSIINYTDNFCNLINETPLTINEWKKQRAVQKNKNTADLLKLGFSTFFLNRTNISGIINAGPIGGMHQNGKYKLDCRFNRADLITRIQKISQFKDRIKIYNLDALELIKLLKRKTSPRNCIFYFDPPYFLKGPTLYMNYYKKEDHEAIAKEIQKIKNIGWIVSYDDNKDISEIYKWVKNRRKFELNHNAVRQKNGKEILLFSDGLKVPSLEF